MTSEHPAVERKRGEREQPHRHLDDAQEPPRIAIASIRRRTHKPPNASPRMNTESISSNECVELPRTSESIRIQPIS